MRFTRATIARWAGCSRRYSVLSLVTSIDALDAYLATTPGGIHAVLVVAFASGAHTGFVFAVQTLRLFVMVLTGPYLVRWVVEANRAGPPLPRASPGGESPVGAGGGPLPSLAWSRRCLSGWSSMTGWHWLLLSAAGTLVVYAAFVGWLLLAGRREDARALAGFIPDCVVLVRRLLGDERVPRRSKWLLAALVAYLALPIDLVPDFIPVAGQLDDAILAAFVLRRVLRAAGPGLLREHWPGPESSLAVLVRLAYGRSGASGGAGPA